MRVSRRLTYGMAGVATLGIAVSLATANATPATTPASAPAPVATDGSFALTPAQWSGLALAPVSQSTAEGAITSDGVVATDDDHTTPVTSPYTGRVERVFVSAGQTVRPGAALFSVSGSELVQARADLTTAEAQVSAGAVAMHAAELNVRRQTTLLAGEAAAARDQHQSEVDLANVHATYRTAAANLAAVRGRLHILGAPADAGGRNGVGTVRATMGGTVISRALGPGQYVQSAATGGTTALITISNLGQVYITANLREADVAAVHVGDHIEATVAALPGERFSGRIAAVGGVVDPATRRVGARAVIDNARGQLRPGMFATIQVSGTRAAGASSLTIPETAVIYEGEGAHVWVARPGHRLEVRQIKAGRADGSRVAVLSGLRPGEQVVTAGAVFIDRAARPE